MPRFYENVMLKTDTMKLPTIYMRVIDFERSSLAWIVLVP